VSELYLVRHGKAGSRERWTGDDRLRPLSKPGRRQAEALVRLFDGRTVERIVSSPFVRCVQTVQPLATDRAVAVEESEALSEGAPLETVLDLVAGLDAVAAVLCSHGDVIPALVEHLAADGMAIEGEPDWRKGSLWILERDGDRILRGRFVAAPA
jgi:phosphohistidine phosphatase SixA